MNWIYNPQFFHLIIYQLFNRIKFVYLIVV